MSEHTESLKPRRLTTMQLAAAVRKLQDSVNVLAKHVDAEAASAVVAAEAAAKSRAPRRRQKVEQPKPAPVTKAKSTVPFRLGAS